jgi:hypothetical protein
MGGKRKRSRKEWKAWRKKLKTPLTKEEIRKISAPMIKILNGRSR